jgi:hypothetical protein
MNWRLGLDNHCLRCGHPHDLHYDSDPDSTCMEACIYIDSDGPCYCARFVLGDPLAKALQEQFG